MSTMTLKSVPDPAQVQDLQVSEWSVPPDIAPVAKWFRAEDMDAWPIPAPSGIYDRRSHEITYHWDFGDGVVDPTAPTSLPTQWRNTGEAWGREVCHVYNAPGDYTVTCEAFLDRVLIARGSRVITISDTEAYFPADRTIVHDPAGVGDPAHPDAQLLTDWADLNDRLLGLGGAPARVLLKRGETIGPFTDRWLPGNAQNEVMYFGAWGTGSRPVVGPRVVTTTTDPWMIWFDQASNGTRRIVADGVRFQGPWKADLEQGWGNRPFRLFWSTARTQDVSFLADNCAFDGFAFVQGFFGTSDIPNAATDFVHNNCRVTNWRDYGIFHDSLQISAGHRAAVIGCGVEQHPDSLNGDGDRTELWNTHGAYRQSRMAHLYVGASNFMTRGGWSIGTRHDGLQQNADNPAVRLNTENGAGSDMVLDRVGVEGNIELVDANPGDRNDRPVNLVADKVLHLMHGRTWQPGPIRINYGGQTWRNVLALMFNATRWHAEAAQQFFMLQPDGVDAENNAAPVHIHNCGLIDMRSDANANPGGVGFRISDHNGNFAALRIENNVTYDGARVAPGEPDEQLDAVTPLAGALGLYAGVRFNFLDVQGTLASPVPENSSFTLPYPRDTVWNRQRIDDGALTDQGYWLALLEKDHQLLIGGVLYTGLQSDFAVEFRAGDIEVTNLQPDTWPATGYALQLDRSSLLPAMATQYGIVGETVATWKPAPGAPAEGDGSVGLKADFDFLGMRRTSPPDRGPYEL